MYPILATEEDFSLPPLHEDVTKNMTEPEDHNIKLNPVHFFQTSSNSVYPVLAPEGDSSPQYLHEAPYIANNNMTESQDHNVRLDPVATTKTGENLNIKSSLLCSKINII